MRLQTTCWLLASTLVSVGCSDPTGSAQVDAAGPGELGLGIDLGNSGIKNVAYVITGSAGFHLVGDLDVSKSSKLATRIGAIPAALGYTVTLSAQASEPPATCSGSASFDVTAGETTPVDLTLQCVEVNAVFNTCPVIDGLSALPNQVAVGGVVALSADVRDPDSGPAALSYNWSTSAGSLNSSGSSATLTCSSQGVATVTLTAGDGDASCTNSQTVNVTCGEPTAPPAVAAPVPKPFMALLGAQLLALGAYFSSRSRKRAARGR